MANSHPDLKQQFHGAMIGIYEAARRLKPPYHATRFLQMVNERGGNPYFAKKVIFPSFSRAAAVLCGRSENGWELWGQWDAEKRKRFTLAEAYELDQTGKFTLVYYDTPEEGEDVVVVSRN